jgi:HemX protein
MERWFLIASTICFLVGFAYCMFALGARLAHPSRWNFIVMLTGFAFQTGFLHFRGQAVGRCPVTNLFEVLNFISWSIVLLYFFIGGTYRLSLLGTFTAPMVFLIQIGALLLPDANRPAVFKKSAGMLPELHAAVSLVAYGAFAMACVAGVMYLVQERLLKKHRLNSIYQNLPPIADLAVAMQRVIFAGVVLLGVGLVVGYLAGTPKDHLMVIWWAIGVWLTYTGVLVARWTHRVSPRRIAWMSVAAFSSALSTVGILCFSHL